MTLEVKEFTPSNIPLIISKLDEAIVLTDKRKMNLMQLRSALKKELAKTRREK